MQPSRRTVLVAGALTAIAGCRPRRQATSRPDPDAPLRAAALDRELALVAAYTSVLAKLPPLAPRLRPLADDKALHVAALGTGTPPATSAVTTVAQLRALERATAAAHGAAAVPASRELAPLLASLAASSSSAAAVL